MTSLPYSEALKQVKAQVAASRSSFCAGMSVLPKARREGMYALYGFCRVVDDIADDSPTPEIAASDLEMWRRRIADVFCGKASDAITTTLCPLSPLSISTKKIFTISLTAWKWILWLLWRRTTKCSTPIATASPAPWDAYRCAFFGDAGA